MPVKRVIDRFQINCLLHPVPRFSLDHHFFFPLHRPSCPRPFSFLRHHCPYSSSTGGPAALSPPLSFALSLCIALLSNSCRPSLGWQCRDLCLSATPPKQQTFVSVADMSTMPAQHVGDILLSWPFLPTKSCLGIVSPTHFSTHR